MCKELNEFKNVIASINGESKKTTGKMTGIGNVVLKELKKDLSKEIDLGWGRKETYQFIQNWAKEQL